MINKQTGIRLSKRQRVRRICELLGVNDLRIEEKQSVIKLIEEFPYLFYLPGDEFSGT